VSWYQKGKINLDFTETRDSQWHWHQMGHMQVCMSLQTDNHASTPPLCFLEAGCPSCCPTNSVRALKESSELTFARISVRPPARPRPTTPLVVFSHHWWLYGQSKMVADYEALEELLEVERELCNRIDEQISDLSELHQNEIVNIKQVPARHCNHISPP